MAKEYLKKLEYLGDYIIGDCKLKSHKYYKELHNYLETIDNANPSEALECLKHIKKYYIPEPCSAKTYDCLETIKQALLKTQDNARSEEILQKYYQEGITLDNVRALKQERDNYKKALEIIKEKRVDMWHLTDLLEQTYEMYLAFCKSEKYEEDYILTEEEFNLLKEVLK